MQRQVITKFIDIDMKVQFELAMPCCSLLTVRIFATVCLRSTAVLVHKTKVREIVTERVLIGERQTLKETENKISRLKLRKYWIFHNSGLFSIFISNSEYISIYIKMNVCLFVCLYFVLNGFKHHTSNHREILENYREAF